MQRSPELEVVVRAWFEAATRGDASLVDVLVSPGAGTRLIGSDPGERFSGGIAIAEFLRGEVEGAGGQAKFAPPETEAFSEGAVAGPQRSSRSRCRTASTCPHAGIPSFINERRLEVRPDARLDRRPERSCRLGVRRLTGRLRRGASRCAATEVLPRGSPVPQCSRPRRSAALVWPHVKPKAVPAAPSRRAGIDGGAVRVLNICARSRSVSRGGECRTGAGARHRSSWTLGDHGARGR
jgi:hypothetical protein